VLATLTALAISLLAGPLVIRKLTAYKIGQAVRNDGPADAPHQGGHAHHGGALVLLSILTATLLWADLSNRFVWVVLMVTFGFGAIGWVDDYRKVVKNNPKASPPRRSFLAVADRHGRRGLPRFRRVRAGQRPDPRPVLVVVRTASP